MHGMTMNVNSSGFKINDIPGDIYVRVNVIIATILQNTVVALCLFSMAQSNETSDFSTVELFTSLLRKLSTMEFASERLPRHSSIRKQIESLVQSPEDLQSLSTTLHKEIVPIISSQPLQKDRKHSFQVELWSLFHAFGVQEVPHIWKHAQQAVSDVDPILTQKVTMEYALVLLQTKYGDSQSSIIEQKEKRGKPSLEEENSIRYVAGFVVMKMKKKYTQGGYNGHCTVGDLRQQMAGIFNICHFHHGSRQCNCTIKLFG